MWPLLLMAAYASAIDECLSIYSSLFYSSWHHARCSPLWVVPHMLSSCLLGLNTILCCFSPIKMPMTPKQNVSPPPESLDMHFGLRGMDGERRKEIWSRTTGSRGGKGGPKRVASHQGWSWTPVCHFKPEGRGSFITAWTGINGWMKASRRGLQHLGCL